MITDHFYNEDITVEQVHEYSALSWLNANVPFAIDAPIILSNTSGVYKTINYFEQKTCLKFVNRTTEDEFVLFVEKENYSFSSVGGQKWEDNTILTLR